jgi:3-oxoacyl-[acyl-carrier protein] reductase
LATDGWKVAIHYSRSESAAQELASELGAGSSGVYKADLASSGAAEELWKNVEADGPVFALVNNAGIYKPLNFLSASDAEFEENLSTTFATNWDAPLRLTRAAARSFATKKEGRILNVASRVGFRGEAGASLYSASKAALINLTRALAVELAPRNLQIFGIAPGWVETAMVRDGMQSRLPDILSTIPVGRMASPEDCAAAASFLLSDDAAYLSGVVIDINGASYFH